MEKKPVVPFYLRPGDVTTDSPDVSIEKSGTHEKLKPCIKLKRVDCERPNFFVSECIMKIPCYFAGSAFLHPAHECADRAEQAEQAFRI